MTGLLLSAVILAPAAPVPIPGAQPGPAAKKIDENHAHQFSHLVDNLAIEVQRIFVKDTLKLQDLIEAAVRGLYEEVGHAVPDSILAAARKASTQINRARVLFDARMLLGNHPNLAGSRALFAAMNGFRHATDSNCSLMSPRINTYASVDQDFGIGIELEGVIGLRWAIYQVEHGIASGQYPPYGYFGTPPKAGEVPSPAVFPWRVRRVIPGSPAQKAGIKPGDVITHLNAVQVTAENVDRIFADFAVPRQAFDPRTGRAAPMDRTLTIRRDERPPFFVTVKSTAYIPESAFGVWRTPEDRWDCILDREYKIGYIRVGPIENGPDGLTGTDKNVADMMIELMKLNCRGLILDLRWCPGGYVDPGVKLAGMFLDDGAIVTKMVITNKERAGIGGDVLAPRVGERYNKLPLAVLVGNDTIGGGELIASALRDNDRCTVIGQRTVGRAMIQNTIPAGFSNVQFRLTTGTSLRPNGKNRQRMPESQPTDEWGVRPDDGLEVPITSDKSNELRRQAELHALRPAESREALPFDDPSEDPYRLAALAYLRKKLGPPNK